MPEASRGSIPCSGPGLLGRSQAVRQRILIPPFGGSIPPAPATHSGIKPGSRRDARMGRKSRLFAHSLSSLGTPALQDMRWKTPKVSVHFREYSRFGETFGGDGFDQDAARGQESQLISFLHKAHQLIRLFQTSDLRVGRSRPECVASARRPRRQCRDLGAARSCPARSERTQRDRRPACRLPSLSLPAVRNTRSAGCGTFENWAFGRLKVHRVPACRILARVGQIATIAAIC